MGLTYENLDDRVRSHMLKELALDVAEDRLYLSPRLSERGRQIYESLLRDAVKHHTDDWLAEQLQMQGCLSRHESRVSKRGVAGYARIPRDAAQTLAEGEFNRLYARGVCLVVLEDGGQTVEVYRGKAVSRARAASARLVGQLVPAQRLLEDLRMSQGLEPALGIPPGPNSGLTVRRPISS